MTKEEREEVIKTIENFPVESTGERKAVLTAIKALMQEKPETVTEFADRCRDCGAKYGKLLKQEPCENAISRSDMLDAIGHGTTYTSEELQEIIKGMPSVKPQPKTEHCKECKWWKDKDGVYRRGIGAESKCPINRREVFEGNGYCFLFEIQESEEI